MCAPFKDALESSRYVCEINHLFEGLRLGHLATFDRSVVMACLKDIALTGLEEFISPTILVDVAVVRVVVLEQTKGSESETVFV
jgi:hypothetical protein